MTTLGKYELHEIIGRGGFGTVYRVTDTLLGREVALKVLHPQLTTDPDFMEKFRNEARLVAALDNPHIVGIYDFGEADGRVFIAMKYLSGGSLKQKLEQEGALSFEEALAILKQICSGLQVAHKKRLVHRDIKPGNTLFDAEGNAVIGDFGLARAIEQSSTSAASSAGGVGTPAYRAPELWIGKPPASPATDIYSLGCVFSEMLTGKVLFEGDTTDQILARHLNLGPNLPETYPAGVPPRMRSVIERAVNKEVKERYPSVADFEQALDEAVADDQKPPEILWTTPLSVEVPAIPNKPEDGFVVSKPPPVSARKARKGVWLAAVGLALVLLIIFCILGGWISSLISGAPSVGTEANATTSEPTDTPVLAAGSTMVSQVDGMTLVYVPAGEFTMGSADGVGESNEHPQHQVYLDAYWIDRTEVTNAMYEECVKDGVCTEPSSNSSNTRDSYYGNSQYDDYPVIYVDWNQAQDYCKWAGRQLPTEAQWEKAARGTDGRIYPWGDGSPDESLANYAGIIGDTIVVGNYPEGASPYGALDMAGNVWEWVADWYGDKYYYHNSSTTNPVGPSSGKFRILRGGGYLENPEEFSSTYRNRGDPWRKSIYFGFRCTSTTNQF